MSSDGTTSQSTAVHESPTNHLVTTQENSSTTSVIQKTSERTVTHVSTTNVQNVTANSQHVITHEKSLQSARGLLAFCPSSCCHKIEEA